MDKVKILSVDDESDLELLLTQYFRRKIRKGEYEFSFAHNGLEALEMLLKNKDYDIILSDINMPEMDGLTLLTKINEMQNPALKCIMVSAYGDMGNIRQAMNNGAFDFATKPIDLDDLSLTIEKAIAQIEYIKRMEQEHLQLEGIKDDLAIASQIQQSILPRVFPPFPELTDRLDIAASMHAAKDVGGDFYDFFRIDDDHIGLVMADVSGKGIPASIFMAISRTIIRTTALQGMSPSDCITHANALIAKESSQGMFVTVFYAIYDVTTGEICYCNAGHNAPYILKADGRVEAFPMSTELVIGIFDDLTYSEAKAQLEPGDMLFTFTDGVTEAMDVDFNMFSEARLADTLAVSVSKDCRQVVDAVKDAVAAFTEGAEQSDDITMLALKRLK
jgi:sigma-B regulation protein RsbU (phosphoserine phosphatase)